jgi:hypothetical protein
MSIVTGIASMTPTAMVSVTKRKLLAAQMQQHAITIHKPPKMTVHVNTARVPVAQTS